MDKLESLKNLAKKLLTEGKTNDEVETILLHQLLDMRKRQEVTIPELESLFRKVKQTMTALQELRSLTG